MFENTSPGSTILAPSTSQAELVSLSPSLLRSTRNVLLSMFMPAGLGIKLAEQFGGPVSEQGVFKQFIQEVEEGLVIKVGSTNFIGKLMPIYIMEILRRALYTGDLLEFGDQNEFDLVKAYDPELDDETRQLYKQRVFIRFMNKLGPHGLKFIQTMHAKDSNSWIAKVITTAQSSLPAPSKEEFELMLRDAFRKQGSLEYADRFSDFFVVKKILGAGTVGIAALIEFKPLHTTEKPIEFVVKIIRKGSREAFENDFKCLVIASEQLHTKHEISEQMAQSFKEFNQEMFNREMLEINPNLENCYLSQSPYELEGVCKTVKGNLALAGKTKGVVWMEKAEGEELGKYVQHITHLLAGASSEVDKVNYLNKLAALRHVYSKLALLHFQREYNNQSVHADLHFGNLFYDEPSAMLSVLDLGSMMAPLDPADHLKVHRFLFALNLSLGTADIHFLRLYYQNEIKENSKLTLEQIEPMLERLQDKLDSIRIENADKNVMDVDASIDQIMSIIKDSILTVGVHIVPSALFIMAKANTPVNDALESLRYILACASYEHVIPYGERTQFAIALKASFQAYSMQKTLWTQEIWDYFVHSILHPKEGFSQLQFTRKFMYGIFDLNEQEATTADVLIPSTIISAPVAVAYCLKRLVNTLGKLPQMIDSYKVMQQFLRSRDAGVRQMTQFLERYNYNHLTRWFSEFKNSQKAPVLTVSNNTKVPLITPKPVTPVLVDRLRATGRGSIRFFAPAMIGGLAVHAYHTLANRAETSDAKSSVPRT